MTDETVLSMTRHPLEPVVVVGAGVSGLTTAICLAEAGHEVRVWAAGPAIGVITGAGILGAIIRLTSARARRVEHVPADGAGLYHHGVRLTEAQFRAAYDAMQAELNALPLPSDRTEAEQQRGYDAVNRLSFVAGTFPHAFPMLGSADSAWEWYAANSHYATRDLPRRRGWAIRP
jgi:glycine/D-amino acid oxidase-like deaminating enzyme